MKTSPFIEKTNKFFKNFKNDFFKYIFVYEDIPSSNIKATELAQQGAEQGTLIITKIQKRGKGRFNRLWESPEGGLYLSIILKPNCTPDKTTLLPLLTSIVVSKTIDIYASSSKIKWPNDVLLNGKKIAGILLESEVIKNKVEYVILGIGINLNTNTNLLTKDVRLISTSLSEEIGKNIDYYCFIKKLLKNFNKYYKIFCNENFDLIIKEWKNQSDTIGKRVNIKTSTEQLTGEVIDIDQSGFLILNTNKGKQRKITSGDCTYIEI
jgi:BirA family biotin operon repressor/biotin-[acetyl-CoA-carboxylase] ligase